MTMHWNRSNRLALLLVGSLATSAAAQPAPAPKKQPTQQELDRARAHFRAAEAAKARGDYKTAAAEYLAAHELFEDSEFFFDAGEVYRLAGDEPNALTYYQKYLQLEPNGRGAATARTAADQLQRSIAAKQDAAKHAADAEAKRKADEDAKRKADEDAAKRAAIDDSKRKADEDAKHKADEDAKRKANEDEAKRGAEAKHKQPATPSEVPPAAPAPATHAWYRDPITVSFLGAGLAGLGVGTTFMILANSEGDKIPKSATLEEARQHDSKANSRRTISRITSGVGIALVLVGGVLIWRDHNSSEQRTVTGWLEPGGGGLAITGAF